MTDKPKFEMGQVVATPGGIDALKSAGQTARELLARHLGGDWGDLDHPSPHITSVHR